MVDGLRGATGAPLDYAAHRPGVRRFRSQILVALAIVAGTAAAATVVLPALNRRCTMDNRTRCRFQLRSIGQAMQMYASESRGAFPPDFNTLRVTQDLTSREFLCPSGHLSYVYVGRGLTNKAPPGAVVAYEPPANHRDGANVLYAQGQVVWVDATRLAAIVSELNAGHNPPRPEKLK
jgi:type II secretory pathway pseudopilin PulG